MRDATIEYKVKVFISSKCGGKYTLVRKALKSLLSETNIVQVFIFEELGASSQHVIDSYITKLDDSDLCVFLIDNKDDVPEAVLREQKRARELKKRALYIFCDEDKKEPTELQLEIRDSFREKYDVVHEFSDFIEKAYTGIMRDVVDIYRNYCREQFIDFAINEETEEINVINNNYIINKELFQGFTMTRNVAKEIIFNTKKEESSRLNFKLDKSLSIMLSNLLGRNTNIPINYSRLANELCNRHESYLKSFITYRVRAIEAYFSNELDECANELENAYNESINNDKIPNWLSNDVLIDWRNIIILQDEINNQYSLETKPQTLLEENQENVYYPLLDRCTGSLSQKLLKRLMNQKIDSPYTTHFEGVDDILDDVSNSFILSMTYGSLTHLLLIRDRMISILSSLNFLYYDHNMYIFLAKLLLIEQKDKELEKIIRAFNQSTDTINETDIENMISGINLIPVPHKRFISKLLILKHYGYYFSDDLFTSYVYEVFKEVEIWIEDENRILSIASYIFEFLIYNISRIDNNKIIEVCITLIEKNFRRYFDNILKVLSRINYSKISTINQERVINLTIDMIRNEEIRKGCNALSSYLIVLRENITIDVELLDTTIKECMNSFYLSEYLLEIEHDRGDETYKHIDRYVEKINQRNKEQGKNGTIIGYADDPYKTIRNIIEFDKLTLDTKHIKSILSSIVSTLREEKQTIGDKIRAIELFIYLKNEYPNEKELDLTFYSIIEDKELVLCGHEDMFFEKASLSTLEFSFMMLQLCFNKYDFSDFLAKMAIFSQKSETEIIESFETLKSFLYNVDFDKLEDSVLSTIIQYSIGLSSHKEKDIRVQATRTMILLCKSKYKELALSQLSKMMDNEIYQIKIEIMYGVYELDFKDNTKKNYIIKKGLADNHYLIRKAANEIKQKISINNDTI